MAAPGDVALDPLDVEEQPEQQVVHENTWRRYVDDREVIEVKGTTCCYLNIGSVAQENVDRSGVVQGAVVEEELGFIRVSAIVSAKTYIAKQVNFRTNQKQGRANTIPFRVLRGDQEAVSSCHFCFDDTRILSCSYDATVKLWDVSTGLPVHVFEGEHTAPISECNISTDNKRMVTSSYDKTVKYWDMETGQVLYVWTIRFKSLVMSCNISLDGKYIVSGLDLENAICISDAENSTEIAFLKDHHMNTVRRCCFDPDSQRVASVSSDRSIKLWDLIAQSTTVTINQGHANVISDCCFTLNGRQLCTASWDKTLKLWDIKTGHFRSQGPVVLDKGHSGSASCCAFSEDGTLVVSGGYDKNIILWNLEGASNKLIIKGHEDWVMDAAISSDKKLIVSCCKDKTLRLWNIENYERISAAKESNRTRESPIVKCEQCGKPFLLLNWDDFNVIMQCVFCRMASPLRNIFPSPPAS
ncbi:WD repeat-containing protein 88 [Microcaecilia unicolor]|uniref:WD repeat-containing protein 88 n=1 Tax=Microcaecilia unicolor TaxID=1415580 RepID=A0A6P7YCZ2_9AMPH|nr:WD repeat-containing protein 88 [Microcaecilia unicolor]